MTDDKAIADKERGGDVLGTVVVILAEDASGAASNAVVIAAAEEVKGKDEIFFSIFKSR